MSEPSARFSADPLIDRFGSVSAFARALGVDRANATRWRRDGIPVDTADCIAVRLGWHPVEIWPEWYAVTGVWEADVA